MRTITLEEHYASPSFFDGPGRELKAQAFKFGAAAAKLFEQLCDVGEKRIAEMDAARIDMQVLSLTSPGTEQIEAADALGLYYWQRTRLIVLPQALALVIPPLVNTFIGMFKDTALVLIISLLDLLNCAVTALTDPNWQGFYVEVYVFVAMIYWCFCFFMSRYSQMLERELNRGKRR